MRSILLMNQRFKEARVRAGMTATAAAKALGVSQTTVSNWDLGRKQPSLELLCKAADLYGVTTDYLLGREGAAESAAANTVPIAAEALQAFHGGPVWSADYGWGHVDAIRNEAVFADQTTVCLSNVGELYAFPPAFAVGYHSLQQPISRQQLNKISMVWVEPLSPDSFARKELRGWYSLRDCCVENEYGQRFYLDTYGSKWLAFETELD